MKKFDAKSFFCLNINDTSFNWFLSSVESMSNKVLDEIGYYLTSKDTVEYLITHAKKYIYTYCIPSVEISGINLFGHNTPNALKCIKMQFLLANHARFLDNVFDRDYKKDNHFLSMLTFHFFMKEFLQFFDFDIEEQQSFIKQYKLSFEYHTTLLTDFSDKESLLKIYWKRISYFYWLPLFLTKKMPQNERYIRLMCMQDLFNSYLLQNDIKDYQKDINDGVITYANFDYFKKGIKVNLDEINKKMKYLINRAFNAANKLELPYTKQMIIYFINRANLESPKFLESKVNEE